MKIILIILCIVFGLILGEQYTSKYDNINVDEILNSDRLLNNYFACLMGRGPCTPDASELKEHIPDALRTTCAKCTDKQKESTIKIVKFLEEKKPYMWKDLQSKYDPDGSYTRKFKTEFKL